MVRLLLVTAVVLAAAANAGVAAERYPLFDATYVTDHDHRLAHVSPVVGTWVANVYGAGCHGKPSAPGGCKSESLDSIQTNGVEIARRRRVRA